MVFRTLQDTPVTTDAHVNLIIKSTFSTAGMNRITGLSNKRMLTLRAPTVVSSTNYFFDFGFVSNFTCDAHSAASDSVI